MQEFDGPCDRANAHAYRMRLLCDRIGKEWWVGKVALDRADLDVFEEEIGCDHGADAVRRPTGDERR